MSATPAANVEPRPLELLGISDPEERVYRWLLSHPRSTAAEAALELTLTVSKTQRLLEAIEAKGLATHSPERPRRYIPVSPDISLEALALRQLERFQHLRRAIKELQSEVATARPRGEQEQMVELITSRETQRLMIEQIDRTARQEVVALVRPPLLISQPALSREQD